MRVCIPSNSRPWPVRNGRRSFSQACIFHSWEIELAKWHFGLLFTSCDSPDVPSTHHVVMWQLCNTIQTLQLFWLPAFLWGLATRSNFIHNISRLVHAFLCLKWVILSYCTLTLLSLCIMLYLWTCGLTQAPSTLILVVLKVPLLPMSDIAIRGGCFLVLLS